MFHNTWTHGGEWLSTTTHTSATRTQGYYGIETKFTNGSWSDMAMTAATPVSSTGFDSLHIAYNPGTTTSHTVYVQTRDENNTDHGSSITLNSYITNMATSTWYSLDIPFSDLGISSGELIKHIIFISQDGPTVYIDDVYLGIPNTGGPNTFSEGMVTLSFDDGWLDHYTEALPILDNENIDATFYIVSEETIQATDLPELVQNRSLESGSIGAPDDWTFNTWGTNDASSTYPVTGIDGADAARVDITNYTDGDAKWYFDDVTVYPDNTYTVSYQYRSDVPNDLTVRFTLQDDSFVYVTATTNPMSTSWASTTATVRSPQNSKSMTVFPILASVGYLEIDNMSVKRNQAYVSPSQVLSIEASGHEIGSHTRHHVALTQVSSALQQDEIETSKDDLLDVGKIGVSSITSLAYPYGDHNTTVQNLTSAHYGNARSTDEGFNYTNTNKYALKIQTVDRNTTLADIEEWVDTARTDKTWLILMFHQIDELTHHTLGISPDLLEDIVTSIANDGIRTVTVTEGVGEME